MPSNKILGITMIAFGGVWVLGAVTGSLAPLLAALFYPSVLVSTGG